MKFSYQYTAEKPQQIKFFVRQLGISRALLAKIKFQGGVIQVNGKETNVLYELHRGDQLTITIPDEAEHETIQRDATPLDILFEDEHLLVVNKPAGVASIPSQYHPNGTMANRVKNYYMENDYPNKVIHVVTRLDRDTTGIMLFAKHGFAHALLDQQLRAKQVEKKYVALVSGKIADLKAHGEINGNITRDTSSLLKRKVSSTEGKPALTEYWMLYQHNDLACVDILLHTGRTHQIRVHFASISCPLLGDDMYGGSMNRIQRQSLHCHSLRFTHPFTGKELQFTSPLPKDMVAVLAEEKND